MDNSISDEKTALGEVDKYLAQNMKIASKEEKLIFVGFINGLKMSTNVKKTD